MCSCFDECQNVKVGSFKNLLLRDVKKNQYQKDIKSVELFYFKEIFNDIITLKF